MVRIRFMEINGLYSYGGEKNRIDFGEKTLIVGPNNSGKSSIFRALDFFLRSLTEYNAKESRTVAQTRLTRNDRWVCAKRFREAVHGRSALDSQHKRYAPVCTLAQSNAVEWFACRLKDVTLTIQWIESSV